tara:strand:+ start:2491 stop:3456 length:966 start_codon:yes stop_codon:yes gene_type:complete
MIRLDLSNTSGFGHHYSGWSFCMSQLFSIHSDNGILFDDFVERAFCWQQNEYYTGDDSYHIPYKRDWIGVIHNPPDVPSWFDSYNSPQAILQRPSFVESLKKCRCLIALSDYLADWIRQRVSVPVISVKHPTFIPEKKWNKHIFLSQHQIPVVQVGYWLRDLLAIRNLKCNNSYQRMWLPSDHEYAIKLLEIQERHTLDKYEKQYTWSGVTMLDRLSDEQYCNLMNRCVVFLKMYDSSANNAVIECIARNTPILVNKLPAVVEYLGEDYPLYFTDIQDAQDKLHDKQKIIKAHEYLKNMDKTFLSGRYFAIDLINKLEQVL